MKRHLFASLIAVSAAVGSAQGQGWYLKGGGGFGISATNDVAGVSIERDSLGKTIGKKNFYGTSGMGPSVRLTGGYFINKHFAVEMEFYYLFGMYHPIAETVSPTRTDLTRERSQQLRVVPALVVDAGFERISPYARFGIMLPIAGKTTQHRVIEKLDQNERVINVVDAFGSFSVGFEASVGMNVKLAKNLCLYAEVNYAGLRIKADRGEVVRDEVQDLDGNFIEDLLVDAPTFTKEIDFVDELTTESNTFEIPGAIDLADESYLDKPVQMLSIRGNYSSFGINVGVRYQFNKKTKE